VQKLKNYRSEIHVTYVMMNYSRSGYILMTWQCTCTSHCYRIGNWPM